MGRTIATNTAVDRAGLLEFLRERHHVILHTHRSDGGVQGSPVTAVRPGDGDPGQDVDPHHTAAPGPVATGGFPQRLA